MTEHNWNFDDAMSVADFFESHNVAPEDRSFYIRTKTKTITNEDGDDEEQEYNLLALANGEEYEGKPSYTFFALSSALEEQGETLDKSFLREHKKDLQLLEPIDGLHCGVAFLGNTTELWDDEW